MKFYLSSDLNIIQMNVLYRAWTRNYLFLLLKTLLIEFSMQNLCLVYCSIYILYYIFYKPFSALLEFLQITEHIERVLLLGQLHVRVDR